MYHYLSKILVWGLYPLTVGMALLLLSYWFQRKRDRQLFRWFFLTGFAILYLFSITPVQRALVRPLRLAQPATVEADAIVVLGGEPARSLTGIRLFKRGNAPIIVTAGGSGKLLEEEQKESDRMSDFLVEFGVPPDKIITESRSKNTRENAVNAKALMDSLNVQTIALVTSSLHMRRSVAVFEKLDYNVLPVNSRLFRIPKKRERFDPFTLFPNVENLSLSTQAIYEYFALILYKILGWV
ncbi:MAG: YdcF family protein [Candidatus Neomarinimicrobiota bacterium]|nr:YdcF family protein [Candidatus Neomarinimicrobiota bacterium]